MDELAKVQSLHINIHIRCFDGERCFFYSICMYVYVLHRCFVFECIYVILLHKSIIRDEMELELKVNHGHMVYMSLALKIASHTSTFIYTA